MMPASPDLSGTDKKVALVTGMAGDIGLAIARRLAADGYQIAGVDKDQERLHTVLAENSDLRAVTRPLCCDVTRPADVERMAVAARKIGAVCLLVNNAGAVTSPSLQSTSFADFAQDTDLNLNAPFNCFCALSGDLIANRGNVINIASANATGVYGHPGYSAAKAGLIHLTRLIAVEYGKFGVRANAVSPGTVQTNAWARRARNEPEIFERLKQRFPLQRIVTTTDIANAVSFLASDAAAAITGACLDVDCGLSAGRAEEARAFSRSDDY